MMSSQPSSRGEKCAAPCDWEGSKHTAPLFAVGTPKGEEGGRFASLYLGSLSLAASFRGD